MTKAPDDLMERLRVAAVDASTDRAERILDMAADEIERLRSQLAAAEAQCETLCTNYADENQRLHDRAEAAEAQLQAMRKALEAGSFQARQWIRKAKGPRDRAVAIAFESFCNEVLRSLTEGEINAK